jgi:hypothetical protein
MVEDVVLRSRDGKLATTEVSDSQQTKLDAIAKDARNNFITREPEGLKFRGNIYEELFVQILEWDPLHYFWKDGKDKDTRHDLTDKEAEELGYKRGADLRIRILNPDVEDEIAELSLPLTSYLNFSTYCDHLKRANMTPKHVVTKLGTDMTQFKVGKPQPVVTFTPVGLIEDWEREAAEKHTACSAQLVCHDFRA